MGNKILIEIAVAGDADSKRRIRDVFDEAKRSNDDVSKKLGGIKNALSQPAGAIQEALAPLTQATGLGSLIGSIGSLLSKLNSPVGFLAGIGAAITGALVGMAKLNEETARLRGRLTALGDGKGLDAVRQQARQAGTDVASLEPRRERFLTFQRRVNAGNGSIQGPVDASAEDVQILGGGPTASSIGNFTKFDTALLAQVRRDVKSKEDADRIVSEFEKGLFSGGLTPDLLRGLQDSSPNAANFLTSQVGRSLSQRFANPEVLAAGLETGRIKPLGAGSVINAGARPDLDAELAARSARWFMQKVEETLARLGVSVDEGAEKASEVASSGLSSVGKAVATNQGDFLRFILNPTAIPGALFGGQTPNARVSEGFAALGGGSDSATSRVSEGFSTLTTQTGETTKSLAGLQTAIDAIVANGSNGTKPTVVEGRASGGLLRGPGSSTSDSIPIMASDGEFIVNAKAASKAGLAHLEWLNAGMPGFAGGGTVDAFNILRGLGIGEHSISPTDDGGAIIDGMYHPPGDPILQTPFVRQALARARQDAGPSKRKYKSDFVGLFGGHNFDTPGSYAEGGAVGRISASGSAFSGRFIDVPGFADGGLADAAMIGGGAAPQLDAASIAPAFGDLADFGRVQLNDGRSDFGVIAHRDVAEALRRAAVDAVNVRTGPAPSWLKGRS